MLLFFKNSFWIRQHAGFAMSRYVQGFPLQTGHAQLIRVSGFDGLVQCVHTVRCINDHCLVREHSRVIQVHVLNGDKS